MLPFRIGSHALGWSIGLLGAGIVVPDIVLLPFWWVAQILGVFVMMHLDYLRE